MHFSNIFRVTNSIVLTILSRFTLGACARVLTLFIFRSANCMLCSDVCYLLNVWHLKVTGSDKTPRPESKPLCRRGNDKVPMCRQTHCFCRHYLLRVPNFPGAKLKSIVLFLEFLMFFFKKLLEASLWKISDLCRNSDSVQRHKQTSFTIFSAKSNNIDFWTFSTSTLVRGDLHENSGCFFTHQVG